MGSLFAQQSMPHEKRAPVGYFEYSLNNPVKYAEPRSRNAPSSVTSSTENFSDSSSQLSWRPAASQSSAQTTPDSISSYGNPSQPDTACLGLLQDPVQSVDVPSWREGVEKEHSNSAPVLPASQRQNSRRTGGGCVGTEARSLSLPTTLVRQPERRHCFVSALVIFAAGLIAAIWPLSAPVLHDTTYAHNVLPLQDFITETLRRSKTSYSTLQVAMYYLILLKAHLPKCDFTQDQSCIPVDRRAMQCGRRMFLSALMLASKFLQDRNYSTRAWGKITGLPTSEINTNELKFLEAVDWKLHVSKEKFERWSHMVIALSSPPKPGMSRNPQPSLVETVGWCAVLDRLTPDCLDDPSQFKNGSGVLDNPSYQVDVNSMLTPPTTPPDSTTSDPDDSLERLEAKHDLTNFAKANESNLVYPVPPAAPYQHNLPTPSGTPTMILQGSSSMCRRTRGSTRCRDSSSALAMLKLCARPANRTLCPPPTQKPCLRSDQSRRPAMNRTYSMSSSTSDSSSPESIRSDLPGHPGRSRSSSISSVASSVASVATSATSSVSVGCQIFNSLEPLSEDAHLASGLQHYVDPSKVDCSSMLRLEEYNAADALLRFHGSHREAKKEPTGATSHDLKEKESTILPNQSLPYMTKPSSFVEKKKKKRTHSRTNMTDLLNIPEDDLQSLVRQDLLSSRGDVEGIIVPEANPKENGGRESKRNRCTRWQSSAVDYTRILMKEKNNEGRSRSGPSSVQL
jgi:PHO85 cyclin-5